MLLDLFTHRMHMSVGEVGGEGEDREEDEEEENDVKPEWRG